MRFTSDVYELTYVFKKSPIDHVNMPNRPSLSFRAKQKELIDQYIGARIFLEETENNDEHWFSNSLSNPEDNTIRKIIYNGYFYESALFFYNAVIDISWVMVYLSVEYVCMKNGILFDATGILALEDAVSVQRKLENYVMSPTAEGNPFKYIKCRCPIYSNIIDLITEFWCDFSTTNIRRNYNYSKHKGKIRYTEYDIVSLNKLFSMWGYSNGKLEELPTSIEDVMYKVSLNESINELLDFDNNHLFPYIKELIEEIEKAIDPSSLVLD